MTYSYPDSLRCPIGGEVLPAHPEAGMVTYSCKDEHGQWVMLLP